MFARVLNDTKSLDCNKQPVLSIAISLGTLFKRLFILFILKIAIQNGKSKFSIEIPILPSVPNLDEFPHVDTQLKILETQFEFNLNELSN